MLTDKVNKDKLLKNKSKRKETFDNEILEGNLDVGKTMLRDYINATITFPALAQRLNKSSKSIHRMLGPSGNPRMDSIVGILKVLQDQEQIRLRARCYSNSKSRMQ